MNRHPIVQGDVLLVPVTNHPGSGSTVARVNGRVILAEGEVTGHAHAISDEACELVTAEDAAGLRTWFLLVTEPVEVLHEEHGSVTVAPGAWQVIRQTEFEPESLRNVMD